jgi:hypothetical protein
MLREWPAVLFCDDDSDRRLPMMGRNKRVMSGVIIGKLDVTTATNVSRTAHEPAC